MTTEDDRYQLSRVIEANDTMLAQRDRQIAGLEARCAEHIAEIERLRESANAVVEGWYSVLDEAEMDPLIDKLRDTLNARKT